MIVTIESQLNTPPGQFNTSHPIFLDPERRSLRVEEFDERLSELIVGQERAVRSMSSWYQIFLAGMNQPNRPLGALLFLGPTGSGKTHSVEAAAEILLGERDVVLKIDCAEFQHSHEIAKLVNGILQRASEKKSKNARSSVVRLSLSRMKTARHGQHTPAALKVILTRRSMR